MTALGRLFCWLQLHALPPGVVPALSCWWHCARCGAQVIPVRRRKVTNPKLGGET